MPHPRQHEFEIMLQRDLDRLDRAFRELGIRANRGKKKVVGNGAKIVRQAIKDRVDIGEHVHTRVSKKHGVVIYYPGNLKKSVSILNFQRSSKLFVGVTLLNGKVKPADVSGSGPSLALIFGFGRAYDGYYLHIYEKGRAGTSYYGRMPVASGFAASKTAAVAAIHKDVMEVIIAHGRALRLV